jgi:hypothetical protein
MPEAQHRQFGAVRHKQIDVNEKVKLLQTLLQ